MKQVVGRGTGTKLQVGENLNVLVRSSAFFEYLCYIMGLRPL